ncbi:MAG: divalent-cation tolerance protein CutA [Deltaproteobacteria bacterium]|nr:divalent-cation tolerance protein CutA [Deltaproteobacteria bacterium]
MCTAADDASAQAIARVLVEERLAACVSLAPVRSTYRWKEAVVNENEVLLVIKTAASLWPRVQQRILELHSYECPEIVALTAAEVDANYMTWLLAACGGVV